MKVVLNGLVYIFVFLEVKEHSLLMKKNKKTKTKTKKTKLKNDQLFSGDQYFPQPIFLPD